MDDQQRKVNIFEDTMAHMTYVQVEEAARKGTIVIFPIGVIEEHGPHLPLAVDIYASYLQSREVKSELKKRGIESLIAPPFYWGINLATGAFGGSFTSKEETVILVLRDAMSCLKRWGLIESSLSITIWMAVICRLLIRLFKLLEKRSG
jgi:creatinine amidohydrolase